MCAEAFVNCRNQGTDTGWSGDGRRICQKPQNPASKNPQTV